MTYSVQTWRNERPLFFREDLSRVLGLVAEKKITPLVGATYPLAEAAAAQRALEARTFAGKIVLVPGGRA